ncbi:hypothetical protein B0O79_1062 [Flavobacteriaceae bacterium MAR_2009_75]|nr:hypothetical protein B0O79_1062 [Flavobacteriaceae bacterium MAR_2009_75]
METYDKLETIKRILIVALAMTVWVYFKLCAE